MRFCQVGELLVDSSFQAQATLHVAERTRHLRKCLEGNLHEKSSVFRGSEGKPNLRAKNLMVFLQMAEGLDDETWVHHLHGHDYSRWVERLDQRWRIGGEDAREVYGPRIRSRRSRDAVGQFKAYFNARISIFPDRRRTSTPTVSARRSNARSTDELPILRLRISTRCNASGSAG